MTRPAHEKEFPMTRRKDKKLKEQDVAWRKSRIDKLIARGWITSKSEIPPDAIPVDPELINLGRSYFRPTYYSLLGFTCSDCGKSQTWTAEDQRWYYETSGAPIYSTAKRCRPCREEEENRKKLARVAAGHAKLEA
jgi:hypothetical protein